MPKSHKTRPVSLTIPKNLVQMLDDRAKAADLTRSKLVTAAIRAMLETETSAA